MILNAKFGRPGYYFGAIFVTASVGYLISPESIPVDVLGVSVLIMGLGLWPAIKWLRSGGESTPMFALLCFCYVLQYGFSVFAQSNTIIIQSQPIEMDWSEIRKAQFLALVGLFFLQQGFRVISLRNVAKHVPKFDLPLSLDRRIALISFSVTISIGVNILVQFTGVNLGGLGAFLRGLPVISLAVWSTYIYMPARVKRASWERIILWILLLWLVLTGLGTTMLEGAVAPIVIVMLIKIARGRQLPVAATLLFVMLLSIFNTTKMSVRAAYGTAEGQQLTVARQVSIWMQALHDADYSKLVRDDPASGAVASWRELLARFDLLHRLAWVCRNTPDRVPYFRGETYRYFVYAPIPRVVWPEKPELSDATALLDYAYELRDPGVGYTYSIGIGFIGEAYANFSWLGVGLILFIEGLVLGVLNEALNGPRSDAGAALYVVIMAAFLNGIGATSIILFGNLVQVVTCGILLLYAFGGRIKLPTMFTRWGQGGPV